MIEDCAQLSVDGNAISPEEVFVHFQADPFPGGHRFKLNLPVELARSAVIERANKFSQSELDSETQNLLLCEIEHSLSLLTKGDNPTIPSRLHIRYVLNNVESIHALRDIVVFSGVCSPLVGKATGLRKGDGERGDKGGCRS